MVGLFYAVGYWNAFFNALLYLNDTPSGRCRWCCGRTSCSGSRCRGRRRSGDRLAGTHRRRLAIKMAVVVVAIVPIAVVYPFVQRHFTKGVIIGAVKG